MDANTNPKPGDVLLGKYQIERVLGQGGMGVVVAARHVVLDERVAIKFLLPSVAGSSEVVRRFLREAQAAVKIRSEHVARVTDVGTMENGAPYIVMEYLDGMDLSDLVEKRGPLPIGDAVEFVLQACEALADAHSLGIVHRDIKPANLFLTTRNDGSPCVKVLDFGISKVRTPDSQALTRTQGVMGSPLYMSPEQLTSAKDVDVRADVYALGVVLYELLTGRQPFEAEDLPQLIVQILQVSPARPRNFRPEIPPDLENALLSCLVKDRNQRMQSVAHLAHALVPFGPPRAAGAADRASRITNSRTKPGGAVAAPPAQASTLAPLGGTKPPTTPSRAPLIAGLAIFMLLVLGGVGFAASRIFGGGHEGTGGATSQGKTAETMEESPKKSATESTAAAKTVDENDEPPAESTASATTTESATAPTPSATTTATATATTKKTATTPPQPAKSAAPKASAKPKAPADDPFGSHVY